MSEEKPAPIRIESCRTPGDVRCPECGLMQAGQQPSPTLPCGCHVCGWSIPCLARHFEGLLAEAIRQLSQVKDVAADAIVKWRRYEDDYILPCFTKAEDAGIDLKRLVSKQAGRNCVEILVDTLRDERDAAIRERDEAKAALTDAIPMYQRLLKERKEAEERAEKAEATVARQAQRIQQQEVAWSASQARAEKAEALLLECREAVDYAAWAADEESDEPHMKKFRDLLSRLPTLKEP